MTMRTAPAPARATAPTRVPAATRVAAPEPAADRALDEALAHISDLAERLWAVRRTHAPVRTRTLLGADRVRCSGCGRPSPCPTLRATDPRPGDERR